MKQSSFPKRLKKTWKKNKKTVQGVTALLGLVLLIILVAIPFQRVKNPGNTFGIDVSYHNGKVAWDEVAENGVEFAILRCGARSYGTGEIKEDSQFKRNMHHAWFHHVDRGVYFYSQAVNEEEAREEAEAVLKFVNGANLALPVFLDIEDTGTNGKGRADGLSREERTAVVLTFANVISEKGYTPGVYANRWYLQTYLDSDRLEAAGIKIWLAEYTSREAPQYTGHYDYWQYTQNGSVPGINGEVDLNK